MPHSNSLLLMRNRHFMAECRRVIASSKHLLTAENIAAIASTRPAPTFYVSYHYALRRIRYYARHGGKFPQSGATAVYGELYRRMLQKMKSGHYNEAQALNLVLAEGNAPCYYLRPRAAGFLYYQLRSNAKRKRCLKRTKSTSTTNPKR